MGKIDDRTQFNLNIDEISEAMKKQQTRESLDIVYKALCEKGYNPSAQIVGYLMSGDPTYITAHNNARIIMSHLDRYDVMVELVSHYMENKKD